MLNTALPVLAKDGTISDNTYQVIAEDAALPQGDVVLSVEQLDLLVQISGKKALYLTVDTSPENHEFPLAELDAIFIEFAGLTMAVVIHLRHCYAVKAFRANFVQSVMYLKMS